MKVFQGERPSHTHENRMLDSFIEAVWPRWETSEDLLYLISNTYWNQAEIDLVCILNSALVVIDFKAFSGKITISENGPWRSGSVPIAGGAKQNPLIQIKHNKFCIMDWLRSRNLLKHCNLGHISGAVVFDGQVEAEGELPPQVSKWFSITSIDGVANYLNSLASPGIRIDAAEADQTIANLNISDYLWSPRQIVNIGSSEQDPDLRPNKNKPTNSQSIALEAIERFINDDTCQVLSVSGMTSTGKSDMVHRLKNVNLGSRSIIILTPNSKLSRRLSKKYSLQVSSIYRHIYDTAAEPKQVTDDKRKVTSLPIRTDTNDREDCIYVIDDAHLVTDSYFEPEPGMRFGSGRLISDFVAYAQLDRAKRKVILLSDPYHISQALASDQFFHDECWDNHKLSGQSITLSQLIRHDQSGAIIDNAEQLVRHIAEGNYSEFDFIVGNGLTVAEGKTAAEGAVQAIRRNPEEILLLAYSNSDVTKINQWARRQRFSQVEQGQAAPGDLLEIYSYHSTDDPLVGGPELSPGDLVTVESVGMLQIHEQTLKGRDKPITFSLQEIRLGVNGQTIHILIDFLCSESKEIEQDIQIATKVWAKAAGRPQPVKARFAYAATAHHARSFRRPRVIVAPPKTMGVHSESYFRWLYTAITRAEQETVVANWKALHVFDKAVLKMQDSSLKKSIPIGAGLQFDPDRALSQEEQELDVPSGLDAETTGIKDAVAIWLALRPVVEGIGFHVLNIQAHPYQVHFALDKEGQSSCELKVSYKGDKTISGIRADDQKRLMDICEGISRKINLDANKSKIVKYFPKLPSLADLRILSLKSSDYRMVLVVGNAVDGLAELELNHDGKGMVSSIRILHYTDERIADRLVGAFESETAA